MAPVVLDPLNEKSSPAAEGRIPLGEYIFRRLEQVKNVKSIFGVPGDFNLNLLEYLYKSSLNWVGGCNELNAGYSADGYSRYTNSLGVLITTFGVGELSAINSIAGAFAEYSKILHIVGLPSTKMNRSHHLHHLVPNMDSLKPSDPLVYTKMVDNISCISKVIDNADTAADAIDEVIKTIFLKSRPGYVFLPVDLNDVLVDPSNLAKPMDFHHIQCQNTERAAEVSEKILKLVYESSSPSILADVLVSRYDNGVELLRNFVDKSKINNYTTFMGKSVLDETNEHFIGDYIGTESNIGIQENVESSDVLLFFGAFINEINTGHYSMDFSKVKNTIILHIDYVKINDEMYHDVNFLDVLNYLNAKFDLSSMSSSNYNELKFEVCKRFTNIPSKGLISQSFLLDQLQSFLKPDDVIVCETCSLMFGIPDLKFPKNVKYIAQGFYLSIGMALPCSLGVSIAIRDENSGKRMILIEGDGSAQMTIQEISIFTQLNLKPVIFLLNNSGYTVERIIKGETRSYNDIKNWNWSKVFDFFNCSDSADTVINNYKLETPQDVSLTLKNMPDTLVFNEVILDKMDCPWRFHHMNGYRHLPEGATK